MMRNKISEITVRFAACVLSAIVLFAPITKVSSDETSGTEFLTYSSTNYGESLPVEAGGCVSLQIRTTADIVYLSLSPQLDCNGQTVEITVYNWNKNYYESVSGKALCTASVSEWTAFGEIGIDFAGMSGKMLPKGEYVIVFTVTKGDTVYFSKYRMSRKGFGVYENGYLSYGALHGFFKTANPVTDPTDYISDQIDPVLHTAPPEYVFTEESAVSQMAVDPTTWTCVDGLGRTLSGYTDVGGKKDKKVGMFYWTWHEQTGNGHKPCNVQAVMDEYPEAKNDFFHPVWEQYENYAFFWNEPLFGYYMENDDYVLRKHAELLADAGVDFVLFDCTNGTFTWEAEYLNLLKVWSQAREEGVKTPQIGFMMQFAPSECTTVSIRHVYNAIYKDGLYQDLWFYWEGKPLIMAYSSTLLEDDMFELEMKNFFTFRFGVGSYFDANSSDEYWGWLHVYPQSVYRNADKSVEMTTVGVCQNSNYMTRECSAQNGPYNTGRSYTAQENFSYSYKYHGETIKVDKNIGHSEMYGLNYQEQWDYAISQNPEIIFVTGWNEWTAGRNQYWGGVENGFPDEFDDENSRDIEPSKGNLKDHYYYQTVENIRRFKGVSKPVAQTQSNKIDINGSFSQWNSSSIITYNHYLNNTYERDGYGYGGIHYTGEGIRNDFVTAKVAYDSKNLYFYCKTASDITPAYDDLWMRLLLDTKASYDVSDDWEGFEYILNRQSPSEGLLTLERSIGGWNWETVGNVRYSVSGNEMMVEIPRSYLGMSHTSVLDFGFKWCDNNLADGDIMTLYTEGDAAPGGRFTFRFLNTPVSDGTDKITALVWSAGTVIVIGFALICIRRMTGKKE